MSVSQSHLLAQYQDMIFFNATFKVRPSLFYHLCPFQIYIKQYKTTILGALILLTSKSKDHYDFAFNSIKNIVTNYTIKNIPYEPKKLLIDNEDVFILSIKVV